MAAPKFSVQSLVILVLENFVDKSLVNFGLAVWCLEEYLSSSYRDDGSTLDCPRFPSPKAFIVDLHAVAPADVNMPFIIRVHED